MRPARPRQTPPGSRPAPARKPPSSHSRINPPRRPPNRKPPTQIEPRNVPALAAKILAAVMSVVVVAVSGYAWAGLQGFVDGVTNYDVIGDGGGGPQPADGSRDILLVGMDSRTDAQGNELPRKLLNKFNAGHDNGELNTDTMILLHIPNDGSKAVALSFPRDSYVEIAQGYGQHKLNSAYGRANVVTTRELTEAGEKNQKTIHKKANQAGAKLLIETIEGLTGRTIDNYASVNLLGFYELTKAVGGVEVCLKEDTQDEKSGADFKAGKQTISGIKALSFVRQRMGLPRGDLDRVVRQQVFMAGLARKVISAGTLTDSDKLEALQGAMKRSVVLNKGWDIVDFARQMSGLSGGQVQFRTIPVGTDIETADGWALDVDPAKVQAFIGGLSKSVRGPKPKPDADAANSRISVDVMNGTGITGLAATVLEGLGGSGFSTGGTGDVPARDTTVVQHAPGQVANAQTVAKYLDGPATVEEDPTLAAGKVTVLIGADYPRQGGGDTSGGGSQAQGESTESAESSNPQDGAATGQPENEKPITADGVRCVN